MVTVLAVLKLPLAVLWASLGISSSLKLSLSSSVNASSYSKLSSESNASTRLFHYGSTVAIFNPLHKRYVQMNKHHQTMSSTGVHHDGDLSLPMHWTYERFTLVDAGHGRVALHNTLSNRFIKMAGDHVTISPIKASNHLPHDWGSEFFEVVDAGHGMVGLHQPGNNRYISMRPDGHLYGSPHHGSDHVPHGWTWQKFFLVPARPYLVPGSVVALYNRPANRFLRMHSTFMDGSGHPPHPPNFPENWGWERFKVVDAGFGRIALHSHSWHRFVKMDHHSVTVSPHSDGSHWPQGWHSEAFVPIPIDPRHNKIVLWHPDFGHCIKQHGHTVIRSPHINAQDVPHSWASEIYEVVTLSDPPAA